MRKPSKGRKGSTPARKVVRPKMSGATPETTTASFSSSDSESDSSTSVASVTDAEATGATATSALPSPSPQYDLRREMELGDREVRADVVKDISSAKWSIIFWVFGIVTAAFFGMVAVSWTFSESVRTEMRDAIADLREDFNTKFDAAGPTSRMVTPPDSTR